jgi:hypothetical protein
MRRALCVPSRGGQGCSEVHRKRWYILRIVQLSRIVAITLIGSAPLFAQVTGNVLTRVFEMRFGGLTGTTFVIDYDDRQYFVTANHMVASAGNEAIVEILGSGDAEWHALKFRSHVHP